MQRVEEGRQKGLAKTFWLAFFISCAIFLPFMAFNRGYFLFMGDFNVQQIPFYQLAHRAVKSGELFWNWHTDLGVNFIGSYSFYLLFSPFFWLTLPFPNHWVPYLMGPLLILKTSLAAATAYLYIKRFVSDRGFAVIGGLLYAFSGYMSFNIFFNHFHDVAVFFPLLLISLEELVQNNRRGFFALMVAINCAVNYWFFIGEAVFVILYVVVRMATGGWGCTPGRFLSIVFESVVGLLMSMAALLPSVMALVGNPRTGADNLLNGWLMWIYGFNQRLPAIIQSFFFPPELPSRPNFFPDMGANWSSLSAWLPLFSAVCVIGYCRHRYKDFHKRMIILSMIMALVPILNSAFVLFNDSYYARWFYMPVLMMCTATAAALEQRDVMKKELKSGWIWTASFIFAISLAVGLSPVKSPDGWSWGLYDNFAGFALIVLAALLCLLLCLLLLFYVRSYPAKSYQRKIFWMLAAVIIVFNFGYIGSGKNSLAYDDWFIDVAVGSKPSLPDEVFARSDLLNCSDNLGMFWELPNIQAFHSVVPASIMKFYPEIGIKRDVSSKPPESYWSLRSLLSVRWLFIEQNTAELPMPDFELFDNQLGFDIYENKNFLPMGFAYDKSISKETAKTLTGEQRSRYMLNAVELDDRALIRNMDILEEETHIDYELLANDNVTEAINTRKQRTADNFVIDKNGFSMSCSFDKNEFLFVSVPFDDGWKAQINGRPAVIERANIGFMGLRVPAGECTVRFDYKTPGLETGTIISVLAAAALIVYLLVALLFKLVTNRRAKRKNNGQKIFGPQDTDAAGFIDPSAMSGTMSIDEYLESLEPFELDDDFEEDKQL
jgi:uncharacterized membrane protein